MAVNIDPEAATSALQQGRSAVESTAGQILGSTSDDPRVRSILDQLGGKTKDDLNRSGGRQGTGSRGVSDIRDADTKGGSAVQSGSAPRLTSTQIASASQAAPQFLQGFAQGFGQASSAATQTGQMGMSGMGASTMTGGYGTGASSAMSYPAGTMMVPASKLSELISAIESGDGPGAVQAAAKVAWNGSTKPDPISVNDVAMSKTVGQMSQAQVSAAIDSAMDKTGVHDPAARVKFKSVLEFMAKGESGNNAAAVNLSDSNATGGPASDGHPKNSSRGPWQTTPSTFASNHAAGTSNNIYDPEASAGAAINYMKERYQIGADGSGLEAFASRRAAGGYTGY